MANPLNVAIKVTGLDQAKSDLASFATIGKRSFNEIANEAKNFAQSAATTDPALRGVANRVRQLAAATDDAFASNLKLRQSISDVERALRAEMISAESATRMTAALRAEHEKLATSTKGVVAEIRQLETIGKISYAGISAMAERAASAIKPTAQSTHDLAVAMKELSLAADPAAAAQMRLLDGLTQVKAALDQKVISTQQAIRLEQYLREQSQETARAEAELANKVRDAAIAKAQASIQAANAQKAASQIAVAAITMEINQLNELQKRKFTSGTATNLPTTGLGAGPAPGSQAQVDLANQMRSLTAAANPLGAANKEYIDTLRAVDIAVKQTIISEEQSAIIKQHLVSVLDKQVAAINRETAAHKNGTGSRGEAAQSISKMGNTMTQLSFQLNDVATSLASGASPFMVIAQQAGQIFQIMQTAPGGVRGALDAIGSAFMKLLTPIGLASTAIVGVGAAMAAIFATQQEMETKARRFNIVLEGFGDKSGATAEDFHRMELNLRALGISAEEAAEGLKAVMTLPGIDRKQLDKIVELGANLGAVTGEGTVAASKRIGEMVSEKDIEKLIEAGIAAGTFDANIIKTLRDMREANNLIGATNTALDKLSGDLKGKHKDGATDFANAVINMGNAWKGFMESLTTSSFFTEGMNRIATTLNEIKAILDAIENLKNRFTRTGEEATKLAQVARADADDAIVQRAKDSGEAVPAAGTARFDTKGLATNTEALERLTKVVAEGSKILPEGFRVEATSTIASRESGTRAHPEGRAMDLRIISPSGPLPNQGPIGADPGWYKQLAIAMYEANKRLFGEGAPITWGGRFETREGSGQLDWMHVAAEGDRGRFGPALSKLAEDAEKATESYIANVNKALKANDITTDEALKRVANARAEVAKLAVQGGPAGLATAAAAGGGTTPAAAPATAGGVAVTRDQTDILTKQNIEFEKAIKIAQTYGFAQIAEAARVQATTEAIERKMDGEVRENYIKTAATNAVKLKIAALETEGKITDETTARNVEAIATAKNSGEAYRLLATAEAQRRVGAAQGVEVDKEAARILNANAEAAVRASKQSVLAAEPQVAAQQRIAEAAKLGGAAQRDAQIQAEVTARFQEATTQARESGNATLIKEIESTKELAAAQLKATQAAGIDARINQQDKLTNSTLETAKSARTLAESYRAMAAAQADANVATGQANEKGAETERILKANAINSIAAATQANFASEQQVIAAEKIAAASAKGTVAQREAEMAAAAAAKTHNVVAQAEASRIPGLEELAKKLTATALAEEKALDAAKQTTAINQRINQRTDQTALVTQQTRMVGQLPETVEAANAKLTEQQALLNAGKKLTDDISVASLKNLDALNKANIAHAEAQRQQERINSMYQQIGSTIESAIGNVIDGIFDPKKAMDWGKAVKDMAKQMFTGIATNFFTKPLIGDLLGLIGAAPTVTAQYGSLLGTTATSGGTAATGGSGTSAIGTLGSLGSIGNAAGLFKGLGLDDTFKGITDFFKGGLGGVFAHTPDVADFAAGSGPVLQVPGSVFGSTTFGSALGGIGGGFAAGTILNSLIGGNKTGGMIGSGGGALAGALIGSIIPGIGTMIGGLIGGAGGGLLGGMFGNSKPSNASAGGNLDLANFKITGGFQGGDPKIDQQMAQMGQTLQSFLALLQTTGGSLSGNVLLQSGVNTGITADSSVPGYEGRFSLGKDTETALKVIEQALVKSITGVSDTMKTVLSQVGTDEDIAKAIQFAKAYDDLAKAAERSFAEIEDATKRMGPFETTMGEIKTLFADLTTQATRFGLALEPINKALEEATRRLQDDFLDAIQTASNVANKKTYRNTIQDTIDSYLASTREASGIGLGDDVSVGNQLGQLFQDQMKELLSGLDESALKDVIKQSFEGLESLNPLIDSLAQAALDQLALADATNEAADAAARGSAAYKAIADLLNSLQVKDSFVQSPEDAIKGANKTFFELFNAASQGSLEAMEGLASASQDYIDAIEQYYGSSEQGQTEVAMIEKGLQDLLNMNPTLAPQDQAVITNQLLTSINTSAMASSNMIATNTDLLGENNAAANAAIAANEQHSKDAIASNNKAAADTIAANKLASDTAIAANTAASAAAVEANTAASNAAIAANNQAAADQIAANDAAAAAMVDANNNAAAGIIAANDVSSQAMITANNEGSAAIVAQNEVASTALIAANDAASAAIIAQNDAASVALVEANNTGAAAIVAQNEAASTALIAANDAGAASIIAQNDAASQLLIAANNEGSAAIVAQNDAASLALIAANDAGVASVIEQNSAASAAMVASNDDATLQVVTNANAATASILAGASADATAIGLVTQNVGNQLSELSTGLANSTIEAIWGAASSIVTGLGTGTQVTAIYDAANSIIAADNIYAINQVSATTNAANSIIAADNIFANNQISATTNAASSIISADTLFASNQISAISGSANSIIAAANVFADNQIAATYGAANSNISNETLLQNNVVASVWGAATNTVLAINTFANNQINATWGAANSIIAADNVYANNQAAATWGAASSMITTANVIANNQVSATYGTANSIISTLATYANNQVAATYNAASSIIGAEAVYANDNLWAITNTQWSNDRANDSIRYYLDAIYWLEVNNGIAQRNTMISLLQQMLDVLRLHAA